MIKFFRHQFKLLVLAGFILCGWVSSSYATLDDVSVAVNKVPAEFFTNKTLQSGDLTITVNTTSGGLEAGMTVSIALVSAAGTTPIANALSVSDVNFPIGPTTLNPQFKCLTASGGQSVRFQVTVTNASNQILTPTSGTNPTYSSAFNIYDLIQSSVAVVQLPDPTHAIFRVDQNVNPNSSTHGVNLVVRSSESSVNFGPEDWMRVKVEMFNFTNHKIVGGLSQENFTPGTDFPLRSSATNYLSFSPRYASYGQNVYYVVTISSADGTLLIPKSGVNPSTTTLVTVNVGTVTKVVLLPMNSPLVRPSAVGHAVFSSTSPYGWTPSALGEILTVKAFLTDAWSNPVDVPNSQIQFGATQYLTLPPFNLAGTWALTDGAQGTVFELDISAFEHPVPITVTSVDGYTSETIYVQKGGIDRNQILAGPSPFNPKLETINFGFQIDTDVMVRILVLDIFGHKVWETDVLPQANLLTTTPWNGRNGNGDMVAAGIYWVVLEKNGEWMTKRKFGVVK